LTARRARGLPGVLFDLDGVLVFSREAWFAVYNDTLRHFGHPAIDDEAFGRIFGNGTEADRAAYMPERSVSEIDAAYRRFFELHLNAVRVNPEAAEALAALRRRGARTAVATNTNAALARRILVRLAARRLALPLDQCVLVGDSRFDEEAARAAPTAFLGYRYGEGSSRIEALSAIDG
jgi:phosphoglycolate phosphatase-like HAD superfamily hydrolase